MSRHIRLLTDEDASHWPRLCARCGAGEPLRPVEATIAARSAKRHGRSERIPVGSDVLTVEYPVCGRHARFQRVAQWLTRNTSASRVVRVLCYALGSGGLLALTFKLTGLLLVAFGVLQGIEASASTLWIALLLALLLLPFAWAYRVTPVRLTRLHNGSVTIRFGFDSYAQAFVEANPRIVVGTGARRTPPTTR